MTPAEVKDAVGKLRDAYDKLSPGEQAQLRRCRTPDDIVLENAFWKIVGPVPFAERARFAPIVVCFPAAKQMKNGKQFRLGRFLRDALAPGAKNVLPGRAIRFRQLIREQFRDDMVRRLRRLLVFADRRVDWPTIGCDVFLWGDSVRRRLAQDFYAPIRDTQTQEDADA